MIFFLLILIHYRFVRDWKSYLESIRILVFITVIFFVFISLRISIWIGFFSRRSILMNLIYEQVSPPKIYVF